MFWLPPSAQRALQHEQQQIDCGTPDPEEDEIPPLLWPVDVEAVDAARATRETEVLYSVPAPVATDEDIAAFYASARKEVKNYPCRVEACYHAAPAPNDLCPVCADDQRRRGILPHYPSGDAA